MELGYGGHSEPCRDSQIGSVSNERIMNITSSKELKDVLNGDRSKLAENSSSAVTSHDSPNSKSKTTYRKNQLVVIQFSAKWCGLCKSIGPLVDVSCRMR